MAWCSPATSHSLGQYWSPYGITWPQWVKALVSSLPVLEIPTGSPVRDQQLWSRTGNFLLIFLVLFFIFLFFMFMIWDSSHEDLQLFWQFQMLIITMTLNITTKSYHIFIIVLKNSHYYIIITHVLNITFFIIIHSYICSLLFMIHNHYFFFKQSMVMPHMQMGPSQCAN